MAYANKTTVSVDRSRAEIERMLTRHGAAAFMYGWNSTVAIISFEMVKRRLKFELPMPDRNAEEFTFTSKGQPRSSTEATRSWEQACRQKWRALALIIKAKLEAVESGICIFEEEFLAHIVLPNGSTVGKHTLPQIEKAYESGRMPLLLENC